jgi:hypothetical protein
MLNKITGKEMTGLKKGAQFVGYEIKKGAEIIGHEIKENTELAEHETGVHDIMKGAKSVFNIIKNNIMRPQQASIKKGAIQS